VAVQIGGPTDDDLGPTGAPGAISPTSRSTKVEASRSERTSGGPSVPYWSTSVR